MHGLLATPEELERRAEALVRIDRVAQGHDVDATVPQAVVHEPADDRQPVRARVPNRPLRAVTPRTESSRSAGAARRRSCSSAPPSQVLGAPGAQALVLDEVVVHRRLVVVAEVQHPGLTVQEPARILEQPVQAQEPRTVGR